MQLSHGETTLKQKAYKKFQLLNYLTQVWDMSHCKMIVKKKNQNLNKKSK